MSNLTDPEEYPTTEKGGNQNGNEEFRSNSGWLHRAQSTLSVFWPEREELFLSRNDFEMKVFQKMGAWLMHFISLGIRDKIKREA